MGDFNAKLYPTDAHNPSQPPSKQDKIHQQWVHEYQLQPCSLPDTPRPHTYWELRDTHPIYTSRLDDVLAYTMDQPFNTTSPPFLKKPSTPQKAPTITPF